MKTVAAVALLLTLVAPLTAQAQKMLTEPPAKGTLHAGERVLVDDHTCPPGQVKEIIGGSNASMRDKVRIPGAPRQVRCIPH